MTSLHHLQKALHGHSQMTSYMQTCHLLRLMCVQTGSQDAQHNAVLTTLVIHVCWLCSGQKLTGVTEFAS